VNNNNVNNNKVNENNVDNNNNNNNNNDIMIIDKFLSVNTGISAHKYPLPPSHLLDGKK